MIAINTYISPEGIVHIQMTTRVETESSEVVAKVSAEFERAQRVIELSQMLDEQDANNRAWLTKCLEVSP